MSAEQDKPKNDAKGSAKQASINPAVFPQPLGQAPGLAQEIAGEYLVSVPFREGWLARLEASSLWEAVMRGASRAHIEWAWEAEWPLLFVITRPDTRTFLVEVERETRPSFLIVGSKESTV